MEIDKLKVDEEKKLQPEWRKYKTARKTAIIASAVLLLLSWGTYFFIPTGELLGSGIVAVIISLIFMSVTAGRGRDIKADLKEKNKRIIIGEVTDKSSTQFKHSTAYKLELSGESINVDSSTYHKAEIGKRYQLEQSEHANVLINFYELEK